MDERNKFDGGMRGIGPGGCLRWASQVGENRGVGVGGFPWGGGRGRCWGGGGQTNPVPQEGRKNSSRGSLVNELGRRVEALEQRLAETTQSREAQPRPLEPE